MSRRIGLFIVLWFGGLLIAGAQDVPAPPPLHLHRGSIGDLEVTGLVPRVPRHGSRFVTREFLLSLPQVSVHIDRNDDFAAITKPGVMVGGVYLDVLAKRLGAPIDAASAVEAICSDGYAAAFPSGYIRIHRPILVLTIGGLSPHKWATSNHGYDAGPYFIAYEHFEPYFKVLAHEDRALEPDEINKLRFTTKEILYAGIEPKESRDPDSVGSPVVSGYRIARQNCFRCHNSGESGGSQSGVSWRKLEKVASEKPESFAQWIYDPRTIDPKAKMPANLIYDKPTLEALTKYFSGMYTEEER